MKIVVTAQGPDLSSEVDPRFGRAAYFLVADTASGSWLPHDNGQNQNAAQGAGIQAARTVADLGAEAVVTGHVGPKAFSALQAAGIAVYTGASGSVADALEQFQQDTLQQAQGPDVQSRWM